GGGQPPRRGAPGAAPRGRPFRGDGPHHGRVASGATRRPHSRGAGVGGAPGNRPNDWFGETGPSTRRGPLPPNQTLQQSGPTLRITDGPPYALIKYGMSW